MTIEWHDSKLRITVLMMVDDYGKAGRKIGAEEAHS